MFKKLLKIMSFYSVARGREIGVYKAWSECEANVKGFPGAIYKKFKTQQEAEDFIKIKNAGTSTSSTGSRTSALSSTLRRTIGLLSAQNGVGTKRSASESQSGQAPKRTKLIESMASNPQTVQHTANISKMKRIGEHDFLIDKDDFVHVYTDGSCEGNGRRGARAGLGVYFGEDHPLNKGIPVVGPATNNRGEIQAATKAIELSIESGVDKLCINTDSQFLIQSATQWMKNWKSKGWKLSKGGPVKNEHDFRALDHVLTKHPKVQIKWVYVPAHSGILGNERADQLAKDGGKLYVRADRS